jgi:aspartyl-tRNA(Asn)/glutamyl-tRNA(Gln) amidotransferase subunit B
MGDLMGMLKAEGREIGESPISPENLGELVKLLGQGELSGKLAKEIFPKMFSTGNAAAAIMEREGLKQIGDTGALEQIVADVIAANPKQVEQYKSGKTTVINFLVGQAMKATRGQANVTAVTDLLKQKLG